MTAFLMVSVSLNFVLGFLLIVYYIKTKRRSIVSKGNSVLKEILDTALTSTNTSQACDNIFNALRTLFRIDYGTILFFDSKKKQFRVSYSEVDVQFYDELSNIVLKVFEKYPQMYTDETSYIQTAKEDYLDYPSGIVRNIRYFSLTPLRISEQLIGALLIENNVPQTNSELEGKFFTLSTKYVAITIKITFDLYRLSGEATLDKLTQVYNRNFLEQYLYDLFKSNSPKSCCFVFLDIDHFKYVNDTYGHDAGDFILSWLCDKIRTFIRSCDVLCRYGGEEFLLILNNMYKEKAFERINLLRDSIEKTPISLPDDKGTISITVSFGISCFPDHSGDYKELIKMADTALYSSKNNGRNRVTMYV